MSLTSEWSLNWRERLTFLRNFNNKDSREVLTLNMGDVTKSFNIASYALLTHMVTQQTDLNVGDFVWTGGDVHLYLNHLEQADEQLQRKPLPLPRLAIKRRPDDIFGYRFEDFEILNYEAHPHIAAAVAV